MDFHQHGLTVFAAVGFDDHAAGIHRHALVHEGFDLIVVLGSVGQMLQDQIERNDLLSVDLLFLMAQQPRLIQGSCEIHAGAGILEVDIAAAFEIGVRVEAVLHGLIVAVLPEGDPLRHLRIVSGDGTAEGRRVDQLAVFEGQGHFAHVSQGCHRGPPERLEPLGNGAFPDEIIDGVALVQMPHGIYGRRADQARGRAGTEQGQPADLLESGSVDLIHGADALPPFQSGRVFQDRLVFGIVEIAIAPHLIQRCCSCVVLVVCLHDQGSLQHVLRALQGQAVQDQVDAFRRLDDAVQVMGIHDGAPAFFQLADDAFHRLRIEVRADDLLYIGFIVKLSGGRASLRAHAQH